MEQSILKLDKSPAASAQLAELAAEAPQQLTAVEAVRLIANRALAELGKSPDLKLKVGLQMAGPLIAGSLDKLTNAEATDLIVFVHNLSFTLEERTGIMNPNYEDE